ncbi:hypothetical protein KR50_28760 [Jeotgalibacillus campisalis]|uniref:UPF0758 domain-containing protein n=1 Tax=Jeotgalibacillus campisalis TaxID=220754 RepID=A0A0C2VP24_9BACL|nr:hypothetical protein KR50_28760 [Jeotgalibacillus campisalis]
MTTKPQTTLMIRDFAEEDRPRERLITQGPQSLSNQELIAILLRTGTKKESVLNLSNRLLHQFEGLRLLKEASLEEIMTISGIGQVKAVQVMAAIEIGRRISNLTFEDRYVIRSPEDGANFLMNDMRFLHQEHFVCPK